MQLEVQDSKSELAKAVDIVAKSLNGQIKQLAQSLREKAKGQAVSKVFKGFSGYSWEDLASYSILIGHQPENFERTASSS